MPNRFRSHEKVRYSRIAPYIYIGTNLCYQNHANILKRLGISVDIGLEYEHAARSEMPRLDITLYLPTRDHHAPTLEKLIVGAALIDTAVNAKRRGMSTVRTATDARRPWLPLTL